VYFVEDDILTQGRVHLGNWTKRIKNDEQITWEKITVEAVLLKYFDTATWYHLMTLGELVHAIEDYGKGEKKKKRRVQIYEGSANRELECGHAGPRAIFATFIAR